LTHPDYLNPSVRTQEMWEVQLRVGTRIAFPIFSSAVCVGNLEVEVRGSKDDLADVPPKGEFLAVWLDAEVIRGSGEELETFMRKSLSEDGAGIIHLCSHTNCEAKHKTRVVAFHVFAFEEINDTGASFPSPEVLSPYGARTPSNQAGGIAKERGEPSPSRILRRENAGWTRSTVSRGRGSNDRAAEKASAGFKAVKRLRAQRSEACSSHRTCSSDSSSVRTHKTREKRSMHKTEGRGEDVVSSASPQRPSKEEMRRPALRLSEGPNARNVSLVSRSPSIKRPRTKVDQRASPAAAKKEA
jgi:hypothetical protein